MAWDQFDQEDDRVVGSDSATVTYRLVRWVLVTGSISRSRTDVGFGVTEEFTSVRAGTMISF